MTIRIRRAAPSDAPALSRLAATTFRETFEAENSAEDMARYLADAFTPERQTAEIADAAGTILLAEHGSTALEAELAGYAHLVAGTAPSGVEGAAPMELKRLYVARGWHGRGVAQALMDAALAAVRSQGADVVWLGVWERNPRAIAFYAKYGFARVGEHTFWLGSDPQTDLILVKRMTPEQQRMSVQITAVAPGEYPRLLSIWEAAVRATHHFLREEDIDELRPIVLDHAFPAVKLACARANDGEIVGFVGTAAHKVEMIFIDPAHRGRGIGRILMLHAMQQEGATEVDVNEQNPEALAFYRRLGFEIVARSPLDSLGKPFPLLHLRHGSALNPSPDTAPHA